MEEGVWDVEDDGVKEDDKEDSEEDGVVEGKVEVVIEEISEEEKGVDEGGEENDNFEEKNYEEDGEEEEEDSEEENGEERDCMLGLNAEEVILHFFDCVVQGEQKADGNIVLSCLEAALHALKQRFPHVSKIIVQSDNAKNLAGKQTKLLLPHVCSAAGLKLVAYYHNEAQSGKDICDTHFSHQQTQGSRCIFGEGKWWDEGVNTQAACCCSHRLFR